MHPDKIEPEIDLNGNVIVLRYECVTSHTARCSGITNMHLSHKYTILRGDRRGNRLHVEERERYVVRFLYFIFQP